MAAYGKGQMLGSGINPESFKQDYSGFARAAEMQAQGLSNLGGSIAGAIKDFGETKKEQKKVDAYNKASAKSIEAAITLGDSYGITGAEQTLRPFLSAYNDPNLSPIEKAAMLDEGKAMIPNLFGRFDKSQAMAIENARNAPPPPKQFSFTGAELKKTDKGDIYVFKGNDGFDYDPKTKLPIYDLDAFGRGESPEVFSNQLGSEAANQIVAGMNLGASPGMGTSSDGGPGVLPQIAGDNTAFAKSIAEASGMVGMPSDVPQDLSPIDGANIAGQVQSAINIDGPLAVAPQTKPIQPLATRYISDKSVTKQEPVNITVEKLNQLISMGVRPSGTLNPDGTFNVTDFNTASLPQGMQIKSDGKGGFEMTQGAGVGSNKNEKAAEERQKQQSSFLDEFTKTAAETIKLLPSLPDNPVGAKFGAALGQLLPASEQGRVVSRLNTLKANLALDKVNEMRAASPTGGSAGNMTEKEWPLFMQAFGSLDAAENRQDLEERLKNASIKLFNRINGTPEQRQSAIEKGTITKQENEIVQKKYDEMLSSLGLAPVKSAVESGVGLDQESRDVLKEFLPTPR